MRRKPLARTGVEVSELGVGGYIGALTDDTASDTQRQDAAIAAVKSAWKVQSAVLKDMWALEDAIKKCNMKNKEEKKKGRREERKQGRTEERKIGR